MRLPRVPPNNAFQPTASRARSRFFAGWCTLAAAECGALGAARVISSLLMRKCHGEHMIFHNPLHHLWLYDGARALTSAMADWAMLIIEPSGQVLPLWRLPHSNDPLMVAHILKRQTPDQQFTCFKNTAMWYGFLWRLSYDTERRFQADALEETAITLQQLTSTALTTFSYPYQYSRSWHAPSDGTLVPTVAWIVERMMHLTRDEALRFVAHLAIDWLRIYPFDELPSNDGKLQSIDLRRGYMLYGMAEQFETLALNSADACEQHFARYQR